MKAKMTHCGKLYTVGYAGLEGAEQLQGLFAQQVLIVDIRYYPASRWRPEWSRKRLMERFTTNYCHVRELGNVNYQSSSLPIELVDAAAGVSWIAGLLQAGRDVCLLCACADWKNCHRRVVAELLQNEIVGIRPIHISLDTILSHAGS
jgi:uncharacterized protein (DUF488 family)